ncbi:hypothetical protein BJ166DRAFT_592624 [Pestalotiopsis sp. NC0098]|nr:hypothetical protein BJ166DRAFT_592624 [Pestalotiopsis sp. NC0098]
MVDFPVAEGMTDAQKSAREIVSQMSDNKGTRIKNLLIRQWGSRAVTTDDMPKVEVSWDRAIELEDGNAFNSTDLVASQLDTLIRFENQCRGPVYFVKQKVFLIQMANFPVIDKLGTGRTPIINGMQIIRVGLKENEDATWSIARVSTPVKKESYGTKTPILEDIEAYRAMQQRLIRPGSPRDIHDNILAGLIASDPRKRLSDLYAWRQWKDENQPLTFVQYETIRCFEFGREHDKMTEAIEKDNLQYFRRSHLIFVDSGE